MSLYDGRPAMGAAQARRGGAALSLLDAGPGDPGLVPVRAVELIAAADVVVVEPGVPPELLERARADAEVLRVSPTDEVDDVADDLVARVRDGASVAHVGTGLRADLLAAAVAAKVDVEVVPAPDLVGVVGAWAGLPLEGAPVLRSPAAADALPGPAVGTLVVQESLAGVPALAQRLTDAGWSPTSPVAVVAAPAGARQTTVGGDLGSLAQGSLAVPPPGPRTGRVRGKEEPVEALLVVGDAARGAGSLGWHEQLPLAGWRVLVPRARAQAGVLADALRAQGALPLEVPTIAIDAPRTPAPMERAMKGIVSGRYAWVIFTSTNAVRALRGRLDEIGLDARVLGGVKVAAVGAATEAELRGFGLRADLVPAADDASAEGLLAVWPTRDEALDPLDRVLLPRADIAAETLVTGLKQRGWGVDDVTAYRTVRAAPVAPDVKEAVRGGGVDAILFTSSSTVRNLLALAGRPAESTVIGVIGPQTAQTARDQNLRVDLVAEEASMQGLVDALAELALERRAEAARPPARTPAGGARRPAGAGKAEGKRPPAAAPTTPAGTAARRRTPAR